VHIIVARADWLSIVILFLFLAPRTLFTSRRHHRSGRDDDQVAAPRLDERSRLLCGALTPSPSSWLELTLSSTDADPATLYPYLSSEAAGVSAMTSLVQSYAARCPSSKIIVAGYSQLSRSCCAHPSLAPRTNTFHDCRALKSSATRCAGRRACSAASRFRAALAHRLPRPGRSQASRSATSTRSPPRTRAPSSSASSRARCQPTSSPPSRWATRPSSPVRASTPARRARRASSLARIRACSAYKASPTASRATATRATSFALVRPFDYLGRRPS